MCLVFVCYFSAVCSIFIHFAFQSSIPYVRMPSAVSSKHLSYGVLFVLVHSWTHSVILFTDFVDFVLIIYDQSISAVVLLQTLLIISTLSSSSISLLVYSLLPIFTVKLDPSMVLIFFGHYHILFLFFHCISFQSLRKY